MGSSADRRWQNRERGPGAAPSAADPPPLLLAAFLDEALERLHT